MRRFVVLIKRAEQHAAWPAQRALDRNRVKIVTGLVSGTRVLHGNNSPAITGGLSIISGGEEYCSFDTRLALRC